MGDVRTMTRVEVIMAGNSATSSSFMTGSRSALLDPLVSRSLSVLFRVAVWLIVCPAVVLGLDVTSRRPPNLLLITVDNLGYGDLKIYNPKSKIKTPNLERLASSGARLTQFYTASPTCTVSRACLLTGRVPQRHGLLKQLAGISGNYGVGLKPEEVLLPEVMKSAGYRTGCFGKWNIGFAEGSRPTDRGFDEFLGHVSGNIDYYSHVYNGKHDLYRGAAGEGVREHDSVGTYSSNLFADSAIDFIERYQGKDPWFCYLPFNAPHFPNKKNKKPGEPNQWQAPASAFGRYDLSPDEEDPKLRYMATITALDDAIGRVLDCLDECGARENTFIFCYSDNGAFKLNRKGIDVGSNEPLRGGGVTCWEGGLRVAALASLPGVIPEGSVVDQPLWSPDLMVTCAGLTGGKLPDVKLDGRDVISILRGISGSQHASFYFEFQTHAALRMGDWKMVREKPEEPWELYHLGDDPSEKIDLAHNNPQKLKELVAEFERWRTEF